MVPNFIKKLWSSVKELSFKFFNANKADLFQSAKEIAKAAASAVLSFDVTTPDGRAKTISYVLYVAKSSGLSWAKKIMAFGEDEAAAKLNASFDHDLKRYIHLALMDKALVEKLADSILPANLKFLNFAIEWALNEIDQATAPDSEYHD